MRNTTETAQIITDVQDALAEEFPALPATVYREALPARPVKVVVAIGGYEITFEGVFSGSRPVEAALKLARRVTAAPRA